MKTLLEKLKPEYLKKINKETEKYPYLSKSIKEQLNTYYFFTDLNINTAYQICSFCGVDFGITELSDLFIK